MGVGIKYSKPFVCLTSVEAGQQMYVNCKGLSLFTGGTQSIHTSDHGKQTTETKHRGVRGGD